MTSLPSGAEAEINEADFKAAVGLKNAIANELKNSKLDIDLSGGIMGLGIEKILPAVLSIDSSEAFDKALFNCLSRCKYKGEKITVSTFEPSDARQDYYPIIIECLKVNLSPFFSGLLSKLKDGGLLVSAAPQK